MTLAGIDISYANTKTPSLAGLSFVFCRAGYGSNTVDVRWLQHSANVRKAGLVLGAYWFWYLGQDNTRAVQTMIGLAEMAGAEILVLDLEGSGADSTAGHDQARQFIGLMHQAGRKVGLYHSASGFPSLGQDYNWIAKWSVNPPSQPWAFWQYQGSPLDKDRFSGDQAALDNLAGRTTGGGNVPGDIMGLSLSLPANPVSGSITVTLGQTVYRVADASPVVLTVAASPRPAYAVDHPGHEPGYLLDITSGGVTEAYFVRAIDSTFTPEGYTQADIDNAELLAARHEWDRQFTTTSGAKITPAPRP